MNLVKAWNARQQGLDCVKRQRDIDVLKENALEIVLQRLQCHMVDEYVCTASEVLNNGLEEVPPFVSKFLRAPHQEHLLALVSEDGEIFIVNTKVSGEAAVLKKFQAHNNAVFDLCWTDDGSRVLTASSDTTAALIDVQTATKISEFKGHTRSLKSIQTRPCDEAVFATGGRDGNIMVWDRRLHQVGDHHNPCNTLRGVHCPATASKPCKFDDKSMLPLNSAVGVVQFLDEYNLISCGVADGCIKMWDIRRSYHVFKNNSLPKMTIFHPQFRKKNTGYSSLLLDDNRCRLFASCTDNKIYEYNCISFDNQPMNTYHGHQNFTFYVKAALSPDNNFLLSGSSDGYAYIWKVGGSGLPVFRLDGHNAEVTSVDWCGSEEITIATCSDDRRYRIWRLPHEDVDICEIHVIRGRCERMAQQGEQRNTKTKGLLEYMQPRKWSAPESEPFTENRNLKGFLCSPTQNLPNFVVDGLNMSDCQPCKRPSSKKKSNWLTELTESRQSKSASCKRQKRMTSSGRSRKEPRCLVSKCLESYFK